MVPMPAMVTVRRRVSCVTWLVVLSADVASGSPEVVLSTTKLFGPPTGGVLRTFGTRYKCWAKRENDFESSGGTLREAGAASEWTPGSVPDAIMLDKNWDVAFRWRALNILPIFGFLRATMPADVLRSMAQLDYLTHRASPHVDPIELDRRYVQHFVDDVYEASCMSSLQYAGEGEPPAASAQTCAAARSCDSCVAVEGCGWCTSGGWSQHQNLGSCLPLDGDSCQRTDIFQRWDVHQCQQPIVGAFTCGPCTGGTELVMAMSSKMNEIGLNSAFLTTCPSRLLACGYDVPFYQERSLEQVRHQTRGYAWTCLGCNKDESWEDLYGCRGSTFNDFQRRFLLAMGHHRRIGRTAKMPGWSTVSYLHNEFSTMFETGVKKWVCSIGQYWLDTRLPLSELAGFKQDLVVYDNDFDVDWDCVRENARGPDGHHLHFQLQRLSGMSRSQWHSVAQKASALPRTLNPHVDAIGEASNGLCTSAAPPPTPSLLRALVEVMVDMNLPGYEYGNLEAALNGAVHVPTAHGVTRDARDYPDFSGPDQKVFGGAGNCAAIGRRVAEVLLDWRGEAEKQSHFMSLATRLKSQEMVELRHFFEDDVAVVIGAGSAEAYRVGYSIGFATMLLYPHANVQVTQTVAESTGKHDWDSAFDIARPNGFDLHMAVWAPDAGLNAHGVLLGPIYHGRLHVAFLPTGFLPLSKAMFGYLATELERRSHRHWLICPETGFVFARQWWYRSNQARMVDTYRRDGVAIGLVGTSSGLNTNQSTFRLFQATFGEAETLAASLPRGKILSFGMLLRGGHVMEYESQSHRYEAAPLRPMATVTPSPALHSAPLPPLPSAVGVGSGCASERHDAFQLSPASAVAILLGEAFLLTLIMALVHRSCCGDGVKASPLAARQPSAGEPNGATGETRKRSPRQQPPAEGEGRLAGSWRRCGSALGRLTDWRRRAFNFASKSKRMEDEQGAAEFEVDNFSLTVGW